MSTAILLHGITASSLTWWRHRADLTELGWTVQTPDLAGHGLHHVEVDRIDTDALADDVARRLPDGTDLLVGHSLGAVVAATLAATRPGWAKVVVLEDPPSLNGQAVPPEVAQGYLQRGRDVRADPEVVRAEVWEQNPHWAPDDVDNAVLGRSRFQVELFERSFAGSTWDLAGRVAAIAAPLFVLAATEPGTVLTGPERDAVLASATESRVVESGHNIHRDRPALWQSEVTRFAREHGLG